MCKKYIYLSICRNVECQSVIGQKHRNRYCRQALDARRLGRCAGGVRVAGEFRHRKHAMCPGCKMTAATATTAAQPQRSLERGPGSKRECPASGPGGGYAAAMLRGLRRRRPKDVFEFAFQLPLDVQIRDSKRGEKSRRCRETEQAGEGGKDERLEVVSPVGTRQDIADTEIGEDHAEVAFNDYGFGDATLTS